MRVIYTKGAREDLNAIVSYLERNYPAVISRFEACLEIVIKRIGDWPESAQEIAERPGVRGVPLIRYPYKVFYKVRSSNRDFVYSSHIAAAAVGNESRACRLEQRR
jgi:plasmid stabilization system protein ParE